MQGTNPANQILQFLQRNDAAPEQDARTAEVLSLVKFHEELQADEVKKERTDRIMYVGGGLGLLAAGALLLPAVAGLLDLGAVQALGYGLLTVLGLFTLVRLNRNPLRSLRERIEKLHARLVKTDSTGKPRGLYRSKRDKIIGGVAAGLARRMGVAPGVVRLMFLFLIPVSFGAAVALYLLLAMGLSFVPEEQED